MNTEDTLTYWTACMKAADLTDKTIRERLIFIRQLARGVDDLYTVTRRELIMWTAEQNWSNSTRVHRRSGLHTFFAWMQDEQLRLDNPAYRLPRVATRKREPNPFTIDEINQLLQGGIYFRTRVMVALHYYLGLRVSEIAAVNGATDIDWAARTLSTIGKGRKPATLPVPAAVWPLFLKMPRDGYWFPNRTANKLFAAGEGHIMGNSVSGLIGEACKRAGIKHRPHDLRASLATEMHDAGVSDFVVQRGMRHSNMDTTTLYLKLRPEGIRHGFEALPALALPDRSGRKRAQPLAA
ncbi:tyrosine-type recombinase/integrase [Pseudarthrobacter sp. J64]|uniref:tyrosine-type recombinase/integrase n=1 Tax=Pseudarthrobacter sp. J64 TaxID=3116485 RepID=UPI002E80C7F3|nr:tyrosine-type recombinase/integrase [Pseudarthrobacter sp. J64]MEE2568618.1 tyrosine-type recombinase/integrase [Pseudarthrobacter sp. J64]